MAHPQQGLRGPKRFSDSPAGSRLPGKLPGNNTWSFRGKQEIRPSCGTHHCNPGKQHDCQACLALLVQQHSALSFPSHASCRSNTRGQSIHSDFYLSLAWLCTKQKHPVTEIKHEKPGKPSSCDLTLKPVTCNCSRWYLVWFYFVALFVQELPYRTKSKVYPLQYVVTLSVL